MTPERFAELFLLGAEAFDGKEDGRRIVRNIVQNYVGEVTARGEGRYLIAADAAEAEWAARFVRKIESQTNDPEGAK